MFAFQFNCVTDMNVFIKLMMIKTSLIYNAAVNASLRCQKLFQKHTF